MARRKTQPTRAFPELMDFIVTNPIERSGILFLPADSHLRVEGETPDKMPTNGYCPSYIDKQTSQEVRGSQDVPVSKLSTIRIQIVDKPTGSPEQWTPAEIFEAIFPSGLRHRGQCRHSLQPLKGWADPGYQAVMALGMKQARLRVPSLIPPMRRGTTAASKNYAPAAPVPRTAEGRAHVSGSFEMEAFNPMSGWQPPNAGEPIPPEHLNAARPGAI